MSEKNTDRFRYLNKYPSHIMVITVEGRAVFLNRHFMRVVSPAIKGVPLILQTGHYFYDFLDLSTSQIAALQQFTHEGTDNDNVFFMKLDYPGLYLGIYVISENYFAIELVDINKEYHGYMTKTIHREDPRGILLNLTAAIKKKKTTEKSGEIRDYYKHIVDKSIDGFFIADDEFVVVQHNRAFEKIFKEIVTAQDSVSILELVNGSSRRMLRKKLQSVIKNGSSETAEVTIGDAGETMHCLLSLNTVREDVSGNLQVYGFVKDITEIKKLQSQLEKEKNYNRGIIEKVNLGFVFVNDSNEYLDYNDEYLSILGLEKSELANKTFYDFTVPRYIDDQKKMMKDLIKTGKSFIFEKEFLRKDGSVVPVLVSLSRLYDKHGNPMGNFAFVKDISEQKRIEKELIEKNIQMQNLITMYNEVSACLIDCSTLNSVYMELARTSLGLLNPACMEIISKNDGGFVSAYATKSLTRSNDLVLDEKVSLIIKKIVDGKRPFFIRDTFTELNDEDIAAFPGLIKNKSAILLPILVKEKTHAVIILSFAESLEEINEMYINLLLGLTKLASMIIERIKNNAEQDLMKIALDRSERLTAMGRIIAGVAHEINNPLSIIQLDLDELKTLHLETDAVPVDIYSELIGSMQEEVERISGIVKQLKDYSNPELIGHEISRVDELLKTFPIKIFLKNLHKKGVSIVLKLHAGRASVRIPKNRLLQVLMNLLTNADDAIGNKINGEIIIETGRVFEEKEMVYISVTDNGAGIPEENFKKIFEPFFTTKMHEGTGLGLSISYSIVKNYEGEITVNSQETRGSQFVVYFPVANG